MAELSQAALLLVPGAGLGFWGTQPCSVSSSCCLEGDVRSLWVGFPWGQKCLSFWQWEQLSGVQQCLLLLGVGWPS